MSENNKVKVRIAGNDISLITSGSTQSAIRIAEFIDNEVKSINNNELSSKMKLILASINITDELFSAQEKIKYLEEISNKPSDEMINLKNDFTKINKEKENLENIVIKFNDKIKANEELINTKNNTIGELNKKIEKFNETLKLKNEDLKALRTQIALLQKNNAKLEKDLEDLVSEI